ncbi:MAG: putative Fe-S cluster assembly protein SufT [Marinobacter sp.]|nr:putative Fe-S cluster assembly protein SufT [Marinobacter sp.]
MQEREVVLTKREVEARLVPSGTEIMIPSDTFVTITQSLGGTFTVAVNGNLARIEGHDADALGKQPLVSNFDTPEDGTVNENQMWEALRNCYDPEIPVNVVELGLIYSCTIEQEPEHGNHIYITMTLTAAGCGMGPVITEDVKTKLEHVPNVDKVTVDLTFDPALEQRHADRRSQTGTGECCNDHQRNRFHEKPAGYQHHNGRRV